jgi:hypothetical protein
MVYFEHPVYVVRVLLVLNFVGVISSTPFSDISNPLLLLLLLCIFLFKYLCISRNHFGLVFVVFFFVIILALFFVSFSMFQLFAFCLELFLHFLRSGTVKYSKVMCSQTTSNALVGSKLNLPPCCVSEMNFMILY